MKKYIIGAIVVIVIIVTVICDIFLINSHNKTILEDENNQVNTLKKVYEDFLSNFNLEEDNIILDATCLKNIINGVEFSDENKEKLKEVEKINDEYDFEYTLSLTYNEKNSTLTLKLEEKERALMTSTQSYKLYVKDDAIVYERDGFGETINTSSIVD